MLDQQLQALDRAKMSDADYALALRFAPLIRFDRDEPFFPTVVGYTVFRESGASPSFPRDVRLEFPAAIAIEYAIWWDWDIQHLYELEHIWVYVDGAGELVAAEASWHGDYNPMLTGDGGLPLEDSRLVLHSEPGKHAFAPSTNWLQKRKSRTITNCGTRAGVMGVLVTPLYEGVIRERVPLNNRLVHTYLERRQFEPSFDFSNRFDLRDAEFVPWPHLHEWIPRRVSAWVDHLRAKIPPHQLRVLRIAHRGVSAYAPENPAASLRKAVELGADMAEIDICVTADDVPVVIHDGNLKRVSGMHGDIADLTLDELRCLTADDCGFISLEDVVRYCRELDLGIYLDIKRLNRVATQSMLAALDTWRYLRQTIFSACHPDYLTAIKAARPDARTSIRFGEGQHRRGQAGAGGRRGFRASLLGGSRRAAEPLAHARMDRHRAPSQSGHYLLARRAPYRDRGHNGAGHRRDLFRQTRTAGLSDERRASISDISNRQLATAQMGH